MTMKAHDAVVTIGVFLSFTSNLGLGQNITAASSNPLNFIEYIKYVGRKEEHVKFWHQNQYNMIQIMMIISVQNPSP
jgi:hypothetical protein